MDDTHQIIEAVETENWDRVEELWLEALDRDPVPLDELFAASDSLIDAGKKNLRRTLLELLSEQLEDTEDWDGALQALRHLVAATQKPATELIERLEAAFSSSQKRSPSCSSVLTKYRLADARHPLKVLREMERWLEYDVGTAVEVTGQGVGKVVDLNLELENIKVDVGGARPISVPFGAVSKYLKRLPDGHFLKRKVEDPEALKEYVTTQPAEALNELLTSLDGEVPVQVIKAALNGLVAPTAWNSWWTKAKKHPCVVSSGSGSRLRYRAVESEASAASSLFDEFENADLRERLSVAKRIIGLSPDTRDEIISRLEAKLSELEEDDPGLAWETASLLLTLQSNNEPAAQTLDDLISTTQPLQLLSGVEDRSARVTVLETYVKQRSSEWVEIWAEWLLHEQNAPILTSIAKRLDSDARDALDSALESVFRHHAKYPAQFIWACELMTEEKAPAAVSRRLTPSILELIPDAFSKAEFSSLRARAKNLLDGGKAAVRVLIDQATPQQASRFATRISRIDSVDPGRQRIIEQAATQAQGSEKESDGPMLVATRGAISRYQAELKQLLEIDIPKTLKGINAAAAEGDLRENFEYHMLRDRQELQSARAAKIQRDLGIVRVLEPVAADTSIVNIGTIIHFEDASGNAPEPVTILGAWDADVDRRIFANESEFAERLLGLEVGDSVEIDGVEVKVREINPWTG
jgi:transcription elongation factor GreA-like protein/transcription elongation GreA/GreB family factor